MTVVSGVPSSVKSLYVSANISAEPDTQVQAALRLTYTTLGKASTCLLLPPFPYSLPIRQS